MENIKIGTDAWWSQTADKLLTAGLDVVKYKLANIPATGDAANTSNSTSTMRSGMMDKLPYILGAVALGGIVLIMVKR